jgi:hypothetical protein
MESTTSIKSEIIDQLNYLSKEGLREVKWFIRVLSEKRLAKQGSDTDKNQHHSTDDFFEICGMWEDRAIDANSIRKMAWRETKW